MKNWPIFGRDVPGRGLAAARRRPSRTRLGRFMTATR